MLLPLLVAVDSTSKYHLASTKGLIPCVPAAALPLLPELPLPCRKRLPPLNPPPVLPLLPCKTAVLKFKVEKLLVQVSSLWS